VSATVDGEEDARSPDAPGLLGQETPAERLAQNLRRAVDTFADHLGRCGWCQRAGDPKAPKARRCSLGADLWRVVLHRAHPARLQEEHRNG